MPRLPRPMQPTRLLQLLAPLLLFATPAQAETTGDESQEGFLEPTAAQEAFGGLGLPPTPLDSRLYCYLKEIPAPDTDVVADPYEPGHFWVTVNEGGARAGYETNPYCFSEIPWDQLAAADPARELAAAVLRLV